MTNNTSDYFYEEFNYQDIVIKEEIDLPDLYPDENVEVELCLPQIKIEPSEEENTDFKDKKFTDPYNDCSLELGLTEGDSFLVEKEQSVAKRKAKGKEINGPLSSSVLRSSSIGDNATKRSDKNIRRGKKEFQCEECQKIFTRRNSLNRHLQTHSDERPFQCTECPKAFKQKRNLVDHSRLHTKWHLNCAECQRIFFTEEEVKNHLQIHSKNAKVHKCPVCQKGFFQKQRYKQHLQTHSKERSFQCDRCPKVYTRKNLLTHHLISHHGEDPFKYTRKNLLAHHSISHHGEEPSKCSECQEECYDLELHLKHHCKKRLYKCNVCLKIFRRNRDLVDHAPLHLGKRSFKCDKCLKSFFYKVNLTRHLKIHSEEKPFECSECQKTLFSFAALNRHLRMHRERKSMFECVKCQKVFGCKSHLTRHLELHSRGESS